MKIQLIVALSGVDYDGLINQLTVKTKALGGKWIANKLTHLDGFIAGLLKMEIDAADVDAFKSMTTEFADVQFRFFELIDADTQAKRAMKFTVEGEDRSGLTSDITQLLYDQDVRVLHFQSQRFPVIGLGTSVFEAHLEVELPPTLQPSTLKSLIESLNGHPRVFHADRSGA